MALFLSSFIWLALWETNILQETAKEKGFALWKNNITCISDSGSMALIFLNDCHQENNAFFQSFLLISLSFAFGELILMIAINVVGRKLFLSKYSFQIKF